MSDYSLPTEVVSPGDLMEAVSNLAEAPRALTQEELGDAISVEDPEHIVSLGIELGLVVEEDGNLEISPILTPEVRHASEPQKSLVLRRHLLRYSPFTSFLTFLIQEGESGLAAGRTNIFYQLGVDEETVETQLISLGEYSGVLSTGGGGIEFEFDFDREIISSQYASIIAKNLNSEIAARLFLENRLGDGPVDFMDDESFEELIAALVLFDDSPRSAIAAASRAAEDFLRDVAHQEGESSTDYSEADGLGHLTQLLNNDEILLTRHFHGGNYLAGMRNPGGGHGKDVNTLDRWSVSPEVAFGYILSTLHFINSVYKYVDDEAQIL